MALSSTLTTAQGGTGLRLDRLTAADATAVFDYCQDPVFERYLTIPWPYLRSDATSFIAEFVPKGWASNAEYTWAIRGADSDELLGVIGLRLPSGSLGFWLGAAHRGRGLLPEAVGVVADWAFSTGVTDSLRWECLVGNTSSARVAEKCGFTFLGEVPAESAYRDGGHPLSWSGRLLSTDPRTPRPGWPWA